MKILLDTHYLIWSFTNPEKLPQWAADLLVSEESEVFFSQASLWEIAIKFNSGKLVIKGMTPDELYEEIEMSHFQCLPLRNEELISFHRLPIEHRDPFDRIMIWQCIRQNIHFLSVDGAVSNSSRRVGINNWKPTPMQESSISLSMRRLLNMKQE